MPTGPEVFEGTWEELAACAPKFMGKRLRITILSRQESSPSPLLEERRTFLRLPLAERRRLLSGQAERLRAHYEIDGEWREWLQGDIVEY